MASSVVGALTERNLELECDAVASTCAELAERNSLSADEFAMEIERLLFSRPDQTNVVTEGLLETLSSELSRERAKRPKIATLNYALGSWDNAAAEVLTDSTNLLRTPPGASANGGPTTGSRDSKKPIKGDSVEDEGQTFARQTVLDILEDIPEASSERCTIARVSAGPPPQQRYMVERLADKAAFLDARIMDFAQRLEEAKGAACAMPLPVTQAVQEPGWFVGRIVGEGEGRLTPGAVALEASVAHAAGGRAVLDLARVRGYRVFPGQVVGVEGVNPTGQALVATQLVASLPAPLNAPPTPGARGFTLAVAAGPFTHSSDLAYLPLQRILRWCRANPPGALVLLGPFVDVEHPLIAGGLLHETFDEIFKQKVLAPVIEFAEGEGTQTEVLLAPSTRDIHHDFVFPQPPFSHPVPANVTHLANPAVFSVNEVVIGCCSTDVLMHLSGQELGQAAPGAGPGDRMAALCAHLIGQRSFYPLHPPALGALLDTSLGSGLCLGDATPHVMLLPSSLAPFAKHVSLGGPDGAGLGDEACGHAVCVNPGRAAKGAATASFAVLKVGPASAATQSSTGGGDAVNPAPNDVRVKVDIYRSSTHPGAAA